MMTVTEYQSIVHLNNVGIHLLQRRCYRQAMQTLGDCVSILKSISARNDEQGDEECEYALSLECLRAKVLEAAYRLSYPEPSMGPMSEPLCVQVLSDTDSPRSTLSEDSDGTLILYLLRIECDDIFTEKDCSIEASIILFNYGMAYRCLSTLTSSLPFVDKLYVGALQMFHLSYSTITSTRSLEEHGASQFDRIQLLAYLTLGHLAQLSYRLGRLEDASEYTRRWQLLHNAVRSSVSFQFITAAAA